MLIYSAAKVNIGLQILRKREDGFHEISTLMYLLPFSDIIEIQKAESGDGFSMSQSGIIVSGGYESDLCYKAWKLYSDATKEIPVRIHVHKQIPIGAGLGGGSSNGASMLLGLNSLSNNVLNSAALSMLATQLGSDCNVFIRSAHSLASGRGEILTDSPIDLSNKYMVLLNPGIHINTAWAYTSCTPDHSSPPLGLLLREPIEKWKDIIYNDFETNVFKEHPEIHILKTGLYNSGAIYSSMSGSGSSVYGIFQHEPVLSARLKKHLIWSGKL